MEAPIFGLDQKTGTRFADMYLRPIDLGWHTKKADITAGFGVYPPTGHYVAGGSDNTGKGMWTYEPFVGATLYLDEKKTVSLATNVFWEFHGTKKDSETKVGQILTLEGGLGKSYLGGGLIIGMGYYSQWKVTADSLGVALALPGGGTITGPGLSDSKHCVGRYPNDQGFDEWYGIPNSSDESTWPQHPQFDPKMAHLEHLMEGRRGEPSRKLKPYDADARREIDLEVTAKTIDFMKRSVQAGKPFFAYVPITQPHLPTEPSKQFAGKTGNGNWADMLAQTDWCVGQILDAVADLKIDDNTIVIFTSDNGPEDTYPWRGWSGPWTGSYVTAMEGSLRVPFLIRWPGKIPAGRVSNEMVHIVDMYTTLGRMAGADIPTDRAVDGVDQTAFLLGKEKSAREFFPIFVGSAAGNELYAMKWRNWKVHLIWQERMNDVPQKLSIPRTFDLYKSPQERADESLNTALSNAWVMHSMFGALGSFQESLKKYPPIATGTLDPCVPAAAR